MSATVAGSVESCSLAGRIMPVAADVDVTIDTGGKTNTAESNGDGSVRIIQQVRPWKITGLQVECNGNQGDLKFLQDLADSAEEKPHNVTMANGDVWGGVGVITEAIEMTTQKSSASVTLMGKGKLERQ